MKYLRSVLIGLAALGMIVFLSSLSFAKEGHAAGKKHHEYSMKLLQDSAAALQQSNPALAKELNNWVDEEAKEAKEWKEKKGRHEARVKLLQDSAAALQKSNPDLAKRLKEMESKHKKKMQEMTEEKNEKEEVGEKIESKEEQNEK